MTVTFITVTEWEAWTRRNFPHMDDGFINSIKLLVEQGRIELVKDDQGNYGTRLTELGRAVAQTQKLIEDGGKLQ